MGAAISVVHSIAGDVQSINGSTCTLMISCTMVDAVNGDGTRTEKYVSNPSVLFMAITVRLVKSSCATPYTCKVRRYSEMATDRHGDHVQHRVRARELGRVAAVVHDVLGGRICVESKSTVSTRVTVPPSKVGVMDQGTSRGMMAPHVPSMTGAIETAPPMNASNVIVNVPMVVVGAIARSAAKGSRSCG